LIFDDLYSDCFMDVVRDIQPRNKPKMPPKMPFDALSADLKLSVIKEKYSIFQCKT
jgi:hypothetical protein